MGTGINLLVIEDNPSDFRLILRHLDKCGLAARCHCVASIEEVETAIAQGGWDAVLSDYSVPKLDFLQMLSTFQTRSPDLPVILVSGSVGEERAVELLKLGVWDFVLKDSLARLVPAIQRSIGDAADRRIRRMAEAALRSSEAEFRAMFDVASIGMAQADVRTGRWLRVNQKMCEITGYSEAEMLRMHVPEITHPEDREKDWDLFQQVVRGEIPDYRSEKRYLRRDAQIAWVNVNMTVIRNAAGEALRTMAAIEDITQRKQAEDQLRKLSRAVEQSPASIVITDPQGRIEYVNPKFVEITGYTFEDAHGQNPRVLKSGELPSKVYEELWRTITAGDEWRGELHNRRKDGSLFWEYAVISAVKDDAGQATHFLAVKEDITARKRAEAELQQLNAELEQRVAARTEELHQAMEKADAANRAKSVFLANMSHEIRTPMNAVLGFTQLLLSDANTKPGQQQHLTRILRSGEHLLNIINEILEMARIESGQSTFNPVAFDLPGMLHELESMFSLRAEAQQVRFAVELAAGAPRFLMADPTKLKQVFINLLGNAFKFTPPGGEVVLRLEATPGPPGQICLKAEVEDTGPGIQPEDAARVFEPFFQTVSGRAAGGTGLGLSISRGFARMMGGDLTVLSGPGVGSRFQLELLLSTAEPGEMLRNGAHPQNVRLKAGSAGYRVLAVDDAPDNCEVLARFLKAMDFDVQCAANGLEALQRCQVWLPGLVILDLRMPIMDGYAACRQMRATHGPALKILILSASVSGEARQQALAAGADAFMLKPFQFGALLERIQELTGVDYIRSETEPSDPLLPAARRAKESIAVRELPAELLSALRKALTAADYDKMLALLNQAGSPKETLSRRLREWIESYDYTALDAFLNPDDSSAL